LLQHDVERLFTVGRDDRVVTFGLEVEAQPIGNVLLVFDNENTAHGEMGSGVILRFSKKDSRPHYEVSRGNSRVNVDPWPSPSLCANTRPPCARAIERTMYRPRPVPLMWRSPRVWTR